MLPEIEMKKFTESFRRGEEKGFTFFFNLFYPALLLYAYKILNNKHDAEEIVEESFIKIWKDPSKFTHHNVIKAWLYTTVRNASYDIQRKQKPSIVPVEEVDAEKSNTFQQGHLNEMIISEVIGQIHLSIKVLPPECQKIFTLMYIHGKTVREIADELKISISTVKNQKARGLEILRRKFPKLGG